MKYDEVIREMLGSDPNLVDGIGKPNVLKRSSKSFNLSAIREAVE